MMIPLYLVVTSLLSIFTAILIWLIYHNSKKQERNSRQERISVFALLSNYIKTFYQILFVFIFIFFLLFSYKYFKPDKPLPFFEFLTEHVDYTGLTIGIIGIFVGLITVIYVEKQNEKSDTRVNDALNKLDTASRGIQENVTTLKTVTRVIHKNITNLSELTRITKIFEKVIEIIKDSDSKSNDLYVLTHLTDFGNFLVRNVAILTRETQNKADDYKKMSQLKFFDSYMRDFLTLKQRFNKEMEDYVIKNKKVSIAVLRNEKLKPDEPDKLKPFLVERIMKGKIVKLINKNSTEEIKYENYNSEDIFIHNPVDNIDSSKYFKPEDILIKDVLKSDCDFIDSLCSRSNNQLNIETLDYVPFQFFLSAPKDTDVDYGWFAIIIFTNYYSLGYENSVVSFNSQNPTLCKGLRIMFEKLVKAQENKDKNPIPLKRLFTGASEINIALKNVYIDDETVVKQIGFNSVTPVPDILAKDHLLILLRDSDIKYSPAATYVRKDSDELEDIMGNVNNKKTYLSVGVFHNPLTHALSIIEPNDGNPLFKLLQRSTPGEKNKIQIAVGGTVNDPKFQIYEEVFDDTAVDSQDYAFFCKLKMKEKWIFVGGGINYFGSRYLDECIREGATKIAQQIVTKSFIAFFEVRSMTESVASIDQNRSPSSNKKLSGISLLFTSYIEDDEIKCAL